MKTLAALICLSCLMVAVQSRAETEAVDARYGPYPSNYKEIVTKWLQTKLLDPASGKR